MANSFTETDTSQYDFSDLVAHPIGAFEVTSTVEGQVTKEPVAYASIQVSIPESLKLREELGKILNKVAQHYTLLNLGTTEIAVFAPVYAFERMGIAVQKNFALRCNPGEQHGHTP